MTVDVPETLAPETLLEQFKLRYDAIIQENQQLAAKIRENEQTALKLQGAMETIQYLHPQEQVEQVEESQEKSE
jgi:hypothetical protein